MSMYVACAIALTCAFDTNGTAGLLLIHASAGAFAGLDCTRLTCSIRPR